MRRSTPYVLLLPAIAIVTAVVLLPLLLSLYSSFTAYRLTRPESIENFIGWANYVRLLQDTDFWAALGRTVLFVTVVLNLEMLLGLGLAILVNRVTWGQRTLRTILMFPMMFSPILVGFQFKFMFNDNIGIVNYLLRRLFHFDHAVAWLVDGRLAFVSLAMAEIWNSTPIFAILLLAGLMSMPQDPLEAARVDGCNAWQAFRHVTLPYLMPFAWIAMTIRSLDVGRAFDIVKIMTDGGPGGRTELLWTLMARVGYEDGRMGPANAIGYTSILLSIGFTIYLFQKLTAARRHMDPA
ncbi:binding-protein-dependent transport systems inner membrane component [Caballeronia udeis]|uniref:Binding-protein-dependent transport systems inner membrane component n=1 Tax=Caballeronia udeis TaxID=1232866 RepID=A0A158GZ84_9BURK|nr:sugar ABC transporter permease [Caballeronia udeis]SAL37362.1 binding-protein-dependent transport systems inner membrane component [Caballeronia udeis]